MMQGIAEYPTISDEKLEEYLGIWNEFIDAGLSKMLEITLVVSFDCSRFPFGHWTSTLTYGEEKRELTREQALRVKDWLDSLKRLPCH